VRATEAGICRGDLAVRAGLADRVGTLRQTIDQMATRFFRNPISRSGVISPNRHSSSVDAQSVSVAAHCSPPAKEAYMQNDPNNRPTPEDEDTSSLHEKDEDVPIIPQPIPNEPEPALGIEQRLHSNLRRALLSKNFDFESGTLGDHFRRDESNGDGSFRIVGISPGRNKADNIIGFFQFNDWVSHNLSWAMESDLSSSININYL